MTVEQVEQRQQGELFGLSQLRRGEQGAEIGDGVAVIDRVLPPVAEILLLLRGERRLLRAGLLRGVLSRGLLLRGLLPLVQHPLAEELARLRRQAQRAPDGRHLLGLHPRALDEVEHLRVGAADLLRQPPRQPRGLPLVVLLEPGLEPRIGVLTGGDVGDPVRVHGPTLPRPGIEGQGAQRTDRPRRLNALGARSAGWRGSWRYPLRRGGRAERWLGSLSERGRLEERVSSAPRRRRRDEERLWSSPLLRGRRQERHARAPLGRRRLEERLLSSPLRRGRPEERSWGSPFRRRRPEEHSWSSLFRRGRRDQAPVCPARRRGAFIERQVRCPTAVG